MGQRLSIADLPDLARGAAFLGTGGGGNPYVGRLLVERAMRETGRDLELLDLADVPDDALIIPTAMMGAPTCIVEKLPRGTEAAASLRRLEAHLGRSAYATMPIEAGGVNSMIPLMVALRLGIPVVDGDGMGRAFPLLQHETFHVYGVSGTPMVVTNDQHDQTLIETHDNAMMEWLARGVTIRMGGVAYIAEYVMDGATAKRVSIAGTIGLGLKIGRAIREAREQHRDPFTHLIETLASTDYSPARLIFAGKIVEVFRRTTEGFARGTVRIRELDEAAAGEPAHMDIEFQNENLIAQVDGDVLSVVPDLICILDAETAEPITTEELRYGQRVRVMAVTVPPIMRTPEALAVWGPRTFGFDVDYTPMPGARPAISLASPG
ncbi:MAG: DUF917 domain-containing protein [Chloroflexia bacterium]|nr:DUF917 domain-containing protein [Chloroflexia bacterium]